MEFDTNIERDFRLKSWNISLSNTLNYKTTTTVQGVFMNIFVGYNSRNKLRWIYITDKSGDLLLRQTFLKHRKLCQLEPISNSYNLNHYITLRLLDKDKSIPLEYDYINWANDFQLCFVGYEYSLEERLQKNITINAVGG